MTLPAVIFNSFSFVALSGVSKMLSSSIKATPSAYAKFQSMQHNRRKEDIANTVGTQEAFSKDNMFTDRITKPSDLDRVNLDLNEDGDAALFVKITNEINSNPKTILSKNALANTFEEIRNTFLM